jgi:hypothetical protein
MHREPLIAGYAPEIEHAMKTFFATLPEKDRRRYAAVEAAKFGNGGLAYISRVLRIDSHTIRQGEADRANLPAGETPQRVRQPDGGRKKNNCLSDTEYELSRNSPATYCW